MADGSSGFQYQRLVLLNRLVSRSSSRAPQEHKPPLHGASDLLSQLNDRRKAGHAIEFLGLRDPGSIPDKDRIAGGKGSDFIALRDFAVEDRGGRQFVKMLFEYVDQSLRNFPVVDVGTFKGRELSGEESERGATAAHVVVRLPRNDEYDDGNYRCTVESVHSLNRSDVERFICRQLRRANADLTFSVTVGKKGQKDRTKEYVYWPRLELFADVSRKLNFATDGGKMLSHMVFTKRSETTAIGKQTAVEHKDVIADVEYKVKARQGPDDPAKFKEWVSSVRSYFETEGFVSKLYYRGIAGGTISGGVHKAVAGASDLLMCPREIINLTGELKQWRAKLYKPVTDQMIDLLEKDNLWVRG